MARKFDGNLANYFSSTLAYDFPSDWTILLRIKNVVSTGDHQIFIGRRGGDTNGWAVGRQSSGQFTFWGFGGVTGSAGNVSLGSAGFEAYAITRAASGSLGTFYKDSITPLGTASITPGASATQGLYIGGMNNSGGNSFPANCELAEIAIFSRVLNGTELGQWFSGDSPELYSTGLVHYWKLDAASGNESDTVGGTTLTQVGAVTATTHPAMNYGGSTPTLVVANGTHSHTADAVVLTTLVTLSVADSTHGHASDSITLTTASNGTITIPAVRDWGTGNLKSGETGVQVDIRSIATGALVVRKSGQTTHATTGVCVVSDASIVAGTTYEVVTRFADGSMGMWDYQAA